MLGLVHKKTVLKIWDVGKVFCILCIHSLYCIQLWCFLKVIFLRAQFWSFCNVVIVSLFFLAPWLCTILQVRFKQWMVCSFQYMKVCVYWRFAFVLISKTSAHVFKSGRWTSFVSNQTQLQQQPKFGEESEYYLDLENEDKKWNTKKSTLLNGELLSHPNISISLLLICL